MPILYPHSRPTESETLGTVAQKTDLISPPGDSDACPCLRSTARPRETSYTLEKHESRLEILVPRLMATRVEVGYGESITQRLRPESKAILDLWAPASTWVL